MSLLRVLPVLIIVVAAGVLGWIAFQAPAREYEPVVIEDAVAATHVPRAVVGEVPAGHVVRTFEVTGMCCDGCPGKLYSALQAVPGVVKAAVSFDAGTASALVPTELDSAQLELALTFDKYSATLRDG